MKLDLSSRYYIAECTVWLLGAILMVSRFIGLAASQTLPLLNVTLEKQTHFSRVVVALLAAATLYLVIEWKQSSLSARKSYWSQARAGLAIFFSGTALWLCYSLIAANTRFAGISPGWYLGFWVIGVLLGKFVSILALASLMIRTPTEANAIHLSRIPAATRAQYKIGIPAVFLLLIAYYVMCYIAPDVIKGLGFLSVAAPFLFIIVADFASLCLKQDEDGKRIPFAIRIAALKKAFDSHDHSYFLIDNGRKLAEKFGIPIKASPEAIQTTMQEKFSLDACAMHFHVEQQEEVQFEFYAKDGNQHNHSPVNRGVRVQKPHGKKGLLRVLVIPNEPEKEAREIEIPTNLVVTHAEKYLSTHTENDDLAFRKIFSYAINQTVIHTMSQQLGPLLIRVVFTWQEDQVEELLKQDIDVNEQAANGWTALLAAAAQGYPRIVQSLLDAGANTEIGNLHGITPLMYSARYGNIEVCRLLLEYGANPDLQDEYGMTALMVATRGGFADLVGLLLKAGACIKFKDRNSMTALDFAHKCKQGKIARMLRTANQRLHVSAKSRVT